MNPIIEFISKPWLGSVLGVLGLLAALIFYLRSRRVTRLAFQHDSLSIVGGGDAAFPAELEIRFADNLVPRVTLERIVIWNAGNTTIGASQAVESDKLRLKLPTKDKILKCELNKVCRQVNGCRIISSPNILHEAFVHFDFLDPGDGMALEILHTGERHDLSVEGTIRGMPKGLSDYGRVRWFAERRMRKLPFPFSHLPWSFSLYVTAFLGVSMAISGLIYPQLKEWFPEKSTLSDDSSGPSWSIFITGIIYALAPVGLLWMRRRRYPSSLEFQHVINESTEAEQADAANRA